MVGTTNPSKHYRDGLFLRDFDDLLEAVIEAAEDDRNLNFNHGSLLSSLTFIAF